MIPSLLAIVALILSLSWLAPVWKAEYNIKMASKLKGNLTDPGYVEKKKQYALNAVNAKPSEIEVVVHPQSVIHSMVEYVDGSVLAQLGNPDMRTPIAYALGYPERLQSGVGSLDLFKIGQLDFEAPDTNKFPCLRLAYEALKLGGNAAAILNAANEIAVESFIQKTIKFTDIPRLIEFVLNKSSIKEVSDLKMLIDTDAAARDSARQWLSRA
jgi:1-deoxy-D-xylulose-5-phosphate reductoisomerase